MTVQILYTAVAMLTIMLIQTADKIAKVSFPASPWWKRWLVEFSIILPPIFIGSLLIPETAPGAATAAILVGVGAAILLDALVGRRVHLWLTDFRDRKEARR